MSYNVVAIQLKYTQSVVWGVLKETLNPNVVTLENPAYIMPVPPSKEYPQGGMVFHSVFDVGGISQEEKEITYTLDEIVSRRVFKTIPEYSQEYLKQFGYTVLDLPDNKIQY